MATRNMAQNRRFAALTWPDVDALPRSAPLLLPIGAPAPPYEARAFILPAIPFGFSGSDLPAASDSYAALVANLTASLADQGFTNVATGPAEIYTDTPELPKATDNLAARVGLIPIGHTEQHGLHLPLSVDTDIIDFIAAQVVTRAPQFAYRLPTFPYGVSTHTRSFPATLNCGGRAFEDFWLSIVDALVARGAQMLYFLSGHGGNMSFLHNIVKYAGERHPGIFCATSFLHTSGPDSVTAINVLRESTTGGMGHACELETSMMLHLRPDLCHMERVRDEIDFIATASYYMDWIEGGALIANPPWEDDTVTGAYGAGSLATAAKGAAWLEVAVQEKISHVHEIIQQHQLRSARRRSRFGRWSGRDF